MSTFSRVYKPYTFWDLPPTHQQFLSVKILHENSKNQAKKLSVQKKCWFWQTPLPPKVYVLYTRENVDIFGWPFK